MNKCREFVEMIARMTTTNEDQESGSVSEDADEALNSLILTARELLKTEWV